MRELAFCICKYKGADQLHSNSAADQYLCFGYLDSTIPCFLDLKFQASSHLVAVQLSLVADPRRLILIAQVVEHPLWEREFAGSITGRAIPKALKMVPMATLLGAQHYKQALASLLTNIATNNASLTMKKAISNAYLINFLFLFITVTVLLSIFFYTKLLHAYVQ